MAFSVFPNSFRISVRGKNYFPSLENSLTSWILEEKVNLYKWKIFPRSDQEGFIPPGIYLQGE